MHPFLQSGTTALHWCAGRGDAISTNLLLGSKANVNIKDKVRQITKPSLIRIQRN